MERKRDWSERQVIDERRDWTNALLTGKRPHISYSIQREEDLGIEYMPYYRNYTTPRNAPNLEQRMSMMEFGLQLSCPRCLGRNANMIARLQERSLL